MHRSMSSMKTKTLFSLAFFSKIDFKRSLNFSTDSICSRVALFFSSKIEARSIFSSRLNRPSLRLLRDVPEEILFQQPDQSFSINLSAGA